MKILVAVDGSPYTKHMLAYLAAHEQWLAGTNEFTVLHVVPAVPPRAAAALDRDVVKAYYEDESEKVFKPIRTFLKKNGVEAACVSKVGHAADHIAALADKGKFDLLIMGSHGHGALGNLVMGSVATKVLANSKTPVLLVR
ncbi:universal stress protein [Azohydromonas caseinilytica]|uniref:Universal stress protein n=1 Tax=Azohydromonas caseinilytica TaxID=2728836 RepID=A0A848F1C2_9BURK|nr:universal stress protein [Azohydromonas caseinilytica]NML13877.1 universal stress protein [Azohydromonas caseinilytica]